MPPVAVEKTEGGLDTFVKFDNAIADSHAERMPVKLQVRAEVVSDRNQMTASRRFRLEAANRTVATQNRNRRSADHRRFRKRRRQDR